MMAEKNLLITTLGYTKNHLHIEYYSCTGKDGELKFCTGISGAEAGVKYILSHHHIDEIIVLGPENAAGSSPDLEPRVLEALSIANAADLGGYTEFDFFCYRLQQYLNNLDIEAHDVLCYAPADKRSQLYSHMTTELAKGRDGLFYLAATQETAYEKFCKAIDKLSSKDEKRWLKHAMYHEMDSFFKLRSLRSNESVTVRFIPVEKLKNGSFSVESMAKVVDTLASRYSEGVNIFVDLQGMDKADSYTMSSMLSLAYSADRAFRIKAIIHTRSLPGSFVNSIDNEIHRYDLETLLSGMRAFTKYGKSELLEEFCRTHEITDKTVSDMLKAMRYVDTGVSLCNLDDLKYGIESLKKILRKHIGASPDAPETTVFNILKRGIQIDYGPLLEGNEVSIPELIEWALKKHFYQQALTMIESLVPSDMVKRGIYYYARTKDDLEEVLSRWNVLYWNEIPKCRYVFKNPDHYFIKSYGRTAINNAQAPQKVSADLAKTMVAQLKGENTQLFHTYSDLKDNDLLYELLYNYYSVGQLRNKVSHAESAERALDNQEELRSNNSFELLQDSLSKFLSIYKSACKAVEEGRTKPAQVVQITDTDFRTYTRQHRLQPLSFMNPDQLLENTCQCEYNGQTMTVTIRMLQPSSEE